LKTAFNEMVKGMLSTGLEVGPDDLMATVEYVKSLPKPFEYKGEGRIQKVAAPVVAP
jgi:2',3'-cyclic-nucleotide 2'-phosphodiesterase/3'-nucleotidase/5'-nucleotidase